MDRNTQHNNYLRAHVLRSRWYKVFIAAAAIVVFITTYMLILPAITLDAKCGKEEHTHTEECYKVSTSLTCQQEEQTGHTHTEACYQTTEDLICGQEESEPVVEEIVNEETGETETVVVSEGHTHDETCYEQHTDLICGQEESEGHTHTESCYSQSKALDCSKEEHTHTESCYHEQSDPNADVENEEIWKATFADVKLTGNWSEDIVAIAKTQVGYKESTKNFIYDEEDEKDGYTRYGAWYGDTYGEWCAMFSSFCIHYAEVGYDANNIAFPLESNCASWISKLQKVGYYHEAANTLYMDQLGRETYTGDDYFLKPGDIIFFNLKQSQYVVSDHVGIVTEVTDKKITTIQGNSNYSVVEKTYEVGDPTIVGFGEIPENPNYVDPNKQDETKTEETKTETKKTSKKKKSAATSTSSTSEKEDDKKKDSDDTEEEIELEVDETQVTSQMMLSAEPGITTHDDADATDMTNYITGITISKDNGGRWQQATEFQEGDRVRMDMSFEIPANTVTTDNPSITYTFPAGLLPAGTHMDGYIYDHGRAVGTYCIETGDDGVSNIVLTYYDEFADGNSFTGTAFFTAEVALGSGQKEVEYDFAGTNTKITVKKKETPYDIYTQKSNELSSDGKSINYVVKIGTTQGTDGPVIVKDDVYKSYAGESIPGATYTGTVTVEKYDSSGNKIQGSDSTQTVSGSSFEFELPELNAGESYKLSYSANVNESAAADDGSLSITNYANGKLKDHPYTNQGDYTTTTVSTTKISKYGSYNQITGQMDFVITINNPSNLDLGDNEVVDVVTTQGISLISTPVIIDASEHELSGGTITSPDGKLFSYKFPSGANASTYYIKYSTTAPEADGATVKNEATYKDGGSKDYKASSNPSVNHRAFGFQKSTKNKWVDDNGVDKFEWQTYMTIPDGNFPSSGYFYEDFIKDATQGNAVYENTHYGIRSEIQNQIQNTFKLNVVENGKVVEKDWSAATSEYIDVEIKYYTEQGGQEVTDDNTEIKYFTVNVTPKAGKTFSASSMYYNYITSGRRTGFTSDTYYFANDGVVGTTHSTPNHSVDMGSLKVNKTISSTSTDDKGKKVEWYSQIDLPQSAMPATGYLFEDEMTDATSSDGTIYPGTHYGTVSEIQTRIQETFKLKVGNEEKNWADATSNYVDVVMTFYKEVDGERVETTSDDDQVKYFTVRVTPKSGQTVEASYFRFIYPTRINQNGINGGYFTYNNTAKVGDKTAKASHSERIMNWFEKSVYTGNAGEWNYTVADYTQDNGKYAYSNKDGTEVDYSDGIVTYRVVVKTGTGAANDGPITISDSLPEGMEYIEGSAKAAAVVFYNMNMDTFSTAQTGSEMSMVQGTESGGWEDRYYFNDHLHPSYDSETNNLTLNLDAGYASRNSYINAYANIGGYGFIAFYYQARITDPAWNNPTTVKKTYVNSAEWQQTGYGSSQTTKIVRPIEEISKLATPETDDQGNVNRIHYNVVINPAAENLNPDTEVLELVDTMNAGSGTASMELQSVKLYEYDPNTTDHVGNPVNTNRYQYHYDADTKQLTMTIPDELACVLQYTYDVSQGMATQDYTISNKVSLMGKEYDSNEVEMDVQESGATSEKSKITLYKVDKDNYGVHLAGVVFQLKWMDRDDHWIVDVERDENGDYIYGDDGKVVQKRYTTDENGQIVFDNDSSEAIFIRQNYLYRLIEESNPNSGYAVDQTEYYFVWLDSKTTADQWYKNEIEGKTFYHGSISQDKIHFFQHEGASIYIENEYKNIAVKKVWVDEDGKDLSNHPSEVTVKLYEAKKQKDIVKVTANFVDPSGNIVKTYETNAGKGSSYSIGWYQPTMGTINCSTEYDLSSTERGDRTLSISSVTEDVTLTITQGSTSTITTQVGVEMADGSFATSYVAWNPQYSYYVEFADGSHHTSGDSWYCWDGINKYKGNTFECQEYQYNQGQSLNCYDITAPDPFQTYPVQREVSGYTKNNYESAINANMVGQSINVYDDNADPKNQVYTVVEKETTVITPSQWYVDGANIQTSIPESEAEESTSEGRIVDTITLNSSNNWENVWGDDTTDYQLKADCFYYVQESAIGGQAPSQTKYTVFYQNNGGIKTGEIVITNRIPKEETPPETTTISIAKAWVDSSGKEITGDLLNGKKATFRLMQVKNGDVDKAVEYTTFTLSKDTGWSKEFTEIPKTTYDAEGNATQYKYYFEEIADSSTVATYQKESIWNILPFVKGSSDATKSLIDGGTVTVTNKLLPETTTVSVEKKWKNANGSDMDTSQLPEGTSVTVDLYKITSGVDGSEKIDTITLDSSNQWRFEKSGLTKTDYKDGAAINYTYYFREAEVSGYVTTYSIGSGQGVKDPSTIAINAGTMTVNNKKQLTDSVSVSKGWFKNIDGNVTDITSQKEGKVDFQLYRVKKQGGSDPTCEHTWNEGVITKEPGEYTDGEKTYTCTKCGATKTEPIGALGHSHNWSGSVTTAATCNSTGVITYTCSGCNETYTEAISVDPNNHTGGTYIDGAYEATDTTEGYTGDTKCSGCGATLETGSVIPATGGGGETTTVEINVYDWWYGSVVKTFSAVPGSSVTIVYSLEDSNDGNPGWWDGTSSYSYQPNHLERSPIGNGQYEVTISANTGVCVFLTSKSNPSVGTYISHTPDLGTQTTNAVSARNAAPRLMAAPAGSTPVSETPSIPEGAQYLGEYSVYADNNWTGTWTFEAEEGYTYTYYVVETTTGEFTTTYEGQGSGNITINNTSYEEKSYELPHTGGMGTKLITMLGILFMAAASGLMILKKHRKEENW